MTITLETIRLNHTEALENAISKFPLEKWSIKPTSLVIKPFKSRWGDANSCGTIRINDVFIGTDNYAKLRDTLDHEISHLIVGLNENHNKIFKRMFSIISHAGRMENGTIKEKDLEIAYKKIKRKFQLWAQLEGHNDILMGPSARRDSRRVNYKPTDKSFQLIKVEGRQFKILSYYYTEEPI